MPRLSDTDTKVEEIQIFLIRKSSVSDRISRLRSLSQTVIQLSRRAIKRANPGLSEKDPLQSEEAIRYAGEILEFVRAQMA